MLTDINKYKLHEYKLKYFASFEQVKVNQIIATNPANYDLSQVLFDQF